MLGQNTLRCITTLLKKKILTREINLIHVSFEDQVVDIFAKALGIDKLRKLLKNAWCTRTGFELEGEC
jgi:hypothetical protein